MLAEKDAICIGTDCQAIEIQIKPGLLHQLVIFNLIQVTLNLVVSCLIIFGTGKMNQI